MRSNGAIAMSDTRRLSPQTTSSSGYHSEFSSTNESPQSIDDVLSLPIEQVSSISSQVSQQPKVSTGRKSLARISSFLRQQYQRAKSKFIPSKRSAPPAISTCTKATSTTPVPSPCQSTDASTSHPSYSSLNSGDSSFIEPVSLRSLYDNHLDFPSNNYSSIEECYSRQARLLSSSTRHPSHSSRRLAAMANHQNASAGHRSLNNQQHPTTRQEYSTLSQSHFPYRYLINHYDLNRTTHFPLSDFLGAKNTSSAFKQYRSRPLEHLSDDPCDLEVAHYFQQTSQCSNPNYFDIYAHELPAPAISFFRQNLTETLC